MPFDPSRYIYQPRPLQQYDFGQGFRDIIEARHGRQRIDNQARQHREDLQETQASRRDGNTRFAATHEVTRAESAHEEAMKRHAKADRLVNDARQAVAAGDLNKADALAGAIVEAGGKAVKTMGPHGRPVWRFEAPAAPDRSQPNYQQTRDDIFGGQPNGARLGQPFVARFGEGPIRNPYDALPGASAAALPQQQPAMGPQGAPSAAPLDPPPGPAAQDTPPGAAADPSLGSSGTAPPGMQLPSPTLPPEGPPGAALPPGTEQPGAEQAPAEQASPDLGPEYEPLQLTPPNPFDPFRLDTEQLVAQNRERVMPFLEGAQRGIPSGYQERFTHLNNAVANIGYSPEESLKLWQPTFNTLAGLIGDEKRAEISRASLGLRSESLDNSRNDRLMRNAQTRVDIIGRDYDLKENAKRWMGVDAARALLEKKTPAADTQAISMIRNLVQSGVMTDKDFENVKNGAILTIWSKIKRGVQENLITNALNPDARRELMGVIALAKQESERNLRLAQEQMLSTVTADRNASEEEREFYINTIAQKIPRSLWDPYVAEAMGVPLPQKSGPMDQSGNFPVGPARTTQDTTNSTRVRAQASRRTSSGKKLEDMSESEIGDLPPGEVENLLDEVK